MTENASKSLWSSELSADYEKANYGAGLAGYVLRRSHALLEDKFGPGVHFPKVIEIGAGSGVHLDFVRHSFDEYVVTDGSQAMLENIPSERLEAFGGRVRLEQADATKLAFPDASCDRLIATHVLEHINRPDEVLQEWMRVLRPGGTLSLVLPCDPGLAWRFGRYFGPRAAARKRGIDYDYVMALEHVNSITNLVAIIQHHFAIRHEQWWPLKIASTDLNVIYAVNVSK